MPVLHYQSLYFFIYLLFVQLINQFNISKYYQILLKYITYYKKSK